MFLNFCLEQLQQTEDTFDGDKKTQQDIWDRITCGCLQALAHAFKFVKEWPADAQSHYRRKLLEVFELQTELKPEKEVKKSGKKQTGFLWSFMGSKWKSNVKAACMQFVAAFITEMPQDIVQIHIKEIAPAVFNLVSEENSILQTTFWREALFTLAKNFPDCWKHISIKKDFLPKLLKCLKAGGYGAPVALYENFVKYLSVCPLYKLHDFDESDKQNKASFKDRCQLLREVLLALNAGIE